MVDLNQISEKPGARRNRKRIGRGMGSGTGKTSGKGHKGQKARSGVSLLGFEGGQMPYIRRLPKRGFNNRWGKTVAVVNVGQIEAVFEAGEEVTLSALATKNLAKGQFDILKVLGDGEFSKKLKVAAHRFSKTAIEKIEKAGGEVVILPGKTTVTQKKRDKKQAKSS